MKVPLLIFIPISRRRATVILLLRLLLLFDFHRVFDCTFVDMVLRFDFQVLPTDKSRRTVSAVDGFLATIKVIIIMMP